MPAPPQAAAPRLAALGAATESSNYAKFQTANPVVRRLIDRFYARLRAIVSPLGADSLLDAGCGEGETIERLDELLPPRVAAVDLSPEAVAFTAARLPRVEVARESVYELPFEDASFDLVLCLEVLEHLDRPDAALAELGRVSGAAVVVSVPHEPWFRAGSLLRGKHVGALGNHPEHVNHWNPASFRSLLERRLEVVSLERSFPWLLASCLPPADRGAPRARPSARSARPASQDPAAPCGSGPASAPAGRG
jgi:SAM-dependent methyltransferase